MIDLVKECLPTYEVKDTLGEGIYGTVFLIDDGLKERAVKVVPLMVERSSAHRTAAQLDSKISQDFHAVRDYYGKIEGPGVLKVHDFHLMGKSVSDSSARGHLIILMERCPANLRDYVLDAKGGLPPAEAIRLMAALATILQRLAADCGETFLVTDLKPANLLINNNRDLLVGDLGGLKRLASVSSTASAQYTPNWSAPETILRAEQPSVKSILYSFGLVSYFLWESRLPFEDADFIERIRLVREQGVDFDRKDVPESVKEIIRKCLSFDPSQRPGDFAAVFQALGEHLPREKQTPPATSAVSEPHPRPAARQGSQPRSAANGEDSSGSRELGGRAFCICPSCGRKNRIKKTANLYKTQCVFCNSPLASIGLPAKQYTETFLVALIGWVLAAIVNISVFQVAGKAPAGWALGWVVAGPFTGFALRYAMPAFSNRHMAIVAVGWALAGGLARHAGPWGTLLWALGWLAGSLVTGLAMRSAMAGYTLPQVFRGVLGWSLGLVAGILAWKVAGPAVTDLFRANSPFFIQNDSIRLAAIEALAALVGVHVLFWQVRGTIGRIKKNARLKTPARRSPAPRTRPTGSGSK